MGTIKYDKNLLTHLVESKKISNRVCACTNELIFPYEVYYELGDCMVSDLSNDELNSFVVDYFDGEYESYDDLAERYDDVYWSTNYDIEHTVTDILEYERFYNTKGEIVWVNGTIPF